MSSHYCVVQHHFPGSFLVPRAIFQQANWWSQQPGIRTSPGCAARTRYPMYPVMGSPVDRWPNTKLCPI